MRAAERIGINAYVILVCLFILAPVIFVVVASFQNARYLAFPIEEYSLRWYVDALRQPEWRRSLVQSLQLAVQATVVATVLGTMAGLAIHYHTFRGKTLVILAFLSPLLLPELLTSLALLYYFASAGLSGTYTSLLLAHIIITLPFVVRMVMTALPNVTRDLEEAARTLGANEFVTLMKVTLPLIAPAIRGGAFFAFAISYNNVLMSLFLGSPRVTLLPIKIWQHLEFVADPTVAAVSTLFLLITFVLMLVLQRLVKIELFPEAR
jgi:putative spermidine/putrescine transport system permease protein